MSAIHDSDGQLSDIERVRQVEARIEALGRTVGHLTDRLIALEAKLESVSNEPAWRRIFKRG